MCDNEEPPRWHDYSIVDMGPTAFPITLNTRRVKRYDPPKIGPDDDPNQWYEIEVTLVVGGTVVSPAVRFPGHLPLPAADAFANAFKAFMESKP